jgi:tetratricopeptide (TPR) repeat protein
VQRVGTSASIVLFLVYGVVLGVASGELARSTARASDFWDEVKNPGLRRYNRHIAEGRAAAAAGRFPEAVVEAEAAIVRLESRPEAWILKGRAFGELGRLDEATTAFERALAIDPDALSAPEDGRHAAQFLAAAGRYDLAAALLPRVLGRMSASSARVELYALYGDVLSALGPERLREAIAAYREAVRQGGRHDPRSALGLSLCLRRNGAEAEARDLARGASVRGRIDGVLHALPIPESERAARRAVALLAIGDREGAREAWREAASGEFFAEHARQEQLALERPTGGTRGSSP